jgi:hypothetical protein
MMTLKEQEDKVYEEFLKVKADFETLLDRKISRKNFKKAIIDATRIAAGEMNKFEVDDEIRNNISEFFKVCNGYLGEVVWNEIKEKNLKIFIHYENTPMLAWNIPIDMFFSQQEQYEVGVKMITGSLQECFISFFLSPELRQSVIKGDESAIRILYNSFNRPSMDSSVVNLKMLKECFPDFYKYITTELDIMTVEQMEAFIKNKNSKKTNKFKKI